MQSRQARKAHSLIGQVYDPRNLTRAWERVKENRGAGGVDGVTVARFEADRDRYLGLLHQKLKDGSYRPRPVRRVEIDTPGSTAKRPLGIPTVMDRVCQQAVVQVLEPIFEPTFRDESFGFRPGRSTHMAMRRIWRQLQAGNNWVVDADIADFFGTLSHDLLVRFVAEKVADGKVLRLLRQFLEAGVLRGQVRAHAHRCSPRRCGQPPDVQHLPARLRSEDGRGCFALTRYADDWVAVCHSPQGGRAGAGERSGSAGGRARASGSPRQDAHRPRRPGLRVLGLQDHARHGDEVQGGRGLACTPILATARSSASRTGCVDHHRRNPKTLEGLLDELNPVVRGWGMYHRRANVRRLFHRLNGWIVRRIWSWRYKRWRNAGWKRLPRQRLSGELGLVNLLQLVPSMGYYRQKGYSR